MPDYKAISSREPKLQAWLYSEDEAEAELDPLEPRKGGWRLIVEHVDPTISNEPVRSTWMESLVEALDQMDYYFPEAPVWKRLDTEAVVDLDQLVGRSWVKREA